MRITETQRRALTILADQTELMVASTFADKMWPTTHRRSAQGSGLAGGGYLGKLAKLGLVQWDTGRQLTNGNYVGWGYKITSAGREALRR